MLERQEEERQEAMRRAIIEQERQRLLHEHAAKLLGYLPKVSTETVLWLENHKKMREMSLIIQKKEADMGNLQKLASELKANVVAKEDEIENHKKELKDVQSRLEKLLQEKRRQESMKTCLSRGVEALEGIQNWVCMVLLTVIGFCVYRLFKYVDYYYSQ